MKRRLTIIRIVWLLVVLMTTGTARADCTLLAQLAQHIAEARDSGRSLSEVLAGFRNAKTDEAAIETAERLAKIVYTTRDNYAHCCVDESPEQVYIATLRNCLANEGDAQ
jgi:hypothetical protein